VPRRLKRNLRFHEERAAKLRNIRKAMVKTPQEFMDLLNSTIRIMLPGSQDLFQITTLEKYRNYESVRTGIQPEVWNALERLEEDQLNSVDKVTTSSHSPDHRRNHEFFPVPIFPTRILENDVISKLNEYEGVYLCYHDLNEYFMITHEPVISVRKYIIDGYDERDGSLIGKLRARNRRENAPEKRLADGMVKFVISPDHRNSFYVVEQEIGRSIPPVSGNLNAEKSDGIPYLYGMLMGFRGKGEGPMVAAKCLLLREDAIEKNETARDGFEQIYGDDFKDEVTENELGSYRWKLVKYFLNGIYRDDGHQCLHA